MSDLDITVSEVQELGEKLRLIATEFENAEDAASDYAEQVSHDGLAHELEEFAENWGVHREKLMDGLRTLAEKAIQAAEGYDGIESELAQALQGGN
ncbi:Excreted virulence factor EspC, type VII ESX diderm [Streptomyces zhaozhouensis]|uniref:Excreted virulence factor EspC, type VII ESX diderm n=1 Tax=Streptomyces zhaozhouensis TaxID=1300267 RepID=A0A286DX16_9ACTN|nr:type VII secretion target [Streptomyces zhaozhouensis]SOD63104.1 Excreted virulence factor EspC, type VII ESX diderm [Streptomyces zhaozhouensis]